ncbi:MAG TPA: hypothetical protein VHH09_02670 [Acidimicrobiales bacterium]|nr:hypothetical protein [Acidimicrobiales bacterium]
MVEAGNGHQGLSSIARRDLEVGDPAELWPAQAYARLLSDPSDGLGMLLLLLKSSHWVHRRCESVTFHDARTVARRVSVDFTVPALAPVIQLNGADRVRLIPLTLLRKKTLVHFSLQDDSGRSLPLIGLRQTQALTKTMLKAWAELVSDGDVGAPEKREHVDKVITALASGTQEDLDWATAQLERNAESLGSELVPRLYQDPCFGVVANSMADKFILMVALNEDVGARRIVKFSYDEPLTLRYKLEAELDGGEPRSHWREQLPAALGLHATRIRFPAPAAENCQSYHFEIEAPPGLRIAEANMLAGRPHDETANASVDQVSGGFPRVNLHVADVPNGSASRAQIHLRVAREGWLSTALIASWSTAAVLIVAWLSALESDDLSSARTVLLAVTGAVASLLVKPQEHRMTSRMLCAIRALTITATALPFLATAVLVFAPNRGWTSPVILLFAALALGLAGLVTVAWARAGQGKDVTSPWEQRRRLPKPRRAEETASPTYREAEANNGYDRPATIVASSEGWHATDRSWDPAMDHSMERRLEQAEAIVRRSAGDPLLDPSAHPAGPDRLLGRVGLDPLRL